MQIQVNSAGYSGDRVTMLCYLDENSGVLVVKRSISYREERATAKGQRIEGLALVTNMDLADLDYRFEDAHLAEAIRSFFTRAGQGLLDIEKSMAIFNPADKIEMDGVDESGRRYRMHDEISNGQMAILMAVSFVERQKPIHAMISATNELADFYSITSI